MARIIPETKRDRISEILPELRRLTASCSACGHTCGVDRTGPGVGRCRAGAAGGDHARWQAAVPHFGEEPMLVGQGGSGTVFFSHCCLRCVFCQNWQISQEGDGREGHYSELAKVFCTLQEQGVENINLVTPTQYILPIVSALEMAYADGLDIPLVYNTNGFDSVALIRLLDGIVDIWLPDLKYMAPEPAERYSMAPDYPEQAKATVRQMFAQSGPLRIQNGVAVSGVLIRHLVLPEDLSGSYDFLLWLHDEGMTDVTISLMSQYSPQYHASRHPEINRPLTRKEYEDVVAFAEKLSFENVLTQEMKSRDLFLPDFNCEKPFL